MKKNKHIKAKNLTPAIIALIFSSLIGTFLIFLCFFCITIKNKYLALTSIFLCLFLLKVITSFVLNFYQKSYKKYIMEEIIKEEKEYENMRKLQDTNTSRGNIDSNNNVTSTSFSPTLDFVMEEESDLSHVDDMAIFENYNSFDDLAKSVILKDYLVLYEMNDKSILSIYNAITGNLLFCDRIDYLNVDRYTGYMNPLSNCVIHSMFEPDILVIALSKDAEQFYLSRYDTSGISKE